MLGACSLGRWWMLLCEFDGRVLRGMQFEARVDAALFVPGARGHVWGAGGCCSRVTVRGWCIVMMFPRYGVWV